MTIKSTQLEPAKILKNLGLSAKETQVYLVLLENGPMLPLYIARQTGLKRTSLYELFPEMLEKGLIREVRQGKRRLFQAVSPESLLREYQRKYQAVKEGFGQILKIFRMEGQRPEVEIFEGFEGMKKLYLRTLESKKEIRCFVHVGKYNPEVLKWLVGNYLPKRIRRGIKLRAILPQEKAAAPFIVKAKEHLRETRVVPSEKFPFRIEGMVQGERVYFASYTKGGPLVGIMIQSRQIAESLSTLFELAWLGAGKFSPKTQ